MSQTNRLTHYPSRASKGAPISLVYANNEFVNRSKCQSKSIDDNQLILEINEQSIL